MRAHANASRDRYIPRGDRLFPAFRLAFVWQQITRQLLANKFVVRLVVVERIDNVVAVPVGFGHGEIAGVSGGVRVARQVEPVAAPAFAVFARTQHSLDKFLVGFVRIIVQKLVDLRGRCRQPSQIVSETTNEGPLIGERRRHQTILLEFRQNELINGVCTRVTFLHVRHSRVRQRLE